MRGSPFMGSVMDEHWGVDYARDFPDYTYLKMLVGGRAAGKSRRVAVYPYVEELRAKGINATAEELIKLYEYDSVWSWNLYEYLIPATGKPPFIERGKLEVIESH